LKNDPQEGETVKVSKLILIHYSHIV
jgi:hypothetical protein